jgi:phosphatidylinositol alpha-1,6-mannosyltransferase
MPSISQRIDDAFYVVAGDGTDRGRLEALAKELGVESRVRFTGQVQDDQLASLYHTSDLFVLPSTGEGFGIVFLEAMFYAKCCIGARAGATPEVIEDGETGVLVDLEQPDGLADAISSLLGDEERRKRMGAAGQQRLAAEFSQAIFAERLQSILVAK